MSKVTIKECINLFGGYSNREDFVIKGVSSIESPVEETLVPYFDEKYKSYLEKIDYGKLNVVILSSEERFKDKYDNRVYFYLHHDPGYVLVEVIKLLYNIKRIPGVHPTAFIDKGSKVSNSCYVGPFVYIGKDVIIGENCIIEAGCKIKDRVIIGNNVYIGENCVIGGEGFGFINSKQGRLHIPHIGCVVIKDNVFIGSNTVIAKGTFKDTVIEEGVKIDSLVQIAHNVTIGKGTVIAAQAGIAGSTLIGEEVIIGGQAGIGDHKRVGDRAIIMAKSGPLGNVKPNEIIAGYPGMPRHKWLRIFAWLKRQI